ncbi:MAG: AIR synthase-related protein [Patescibacteria group bacterium]
MIQKIRVISTNPNDDLLSKSLLFEIRKNLKINSIKKIRTAKAYRLEGVTEKEALLLSQKLFSEKINQIFSINKSIFNKNYHSFEIAYKPGVMNPEVASIIASAKNLGINLISCDSSREYYFYGNATIKYLKDLIRKLNLLNTTVEHIVEKEPKTLIVRGSPGETSIISIRRVGDEKLMFLSKDKLFLNLSEMKVIQKYFNKLKRDPTDCELETIAQTWSEHSGHKTFKAKLFVDGKEKKPLIERLKNEALKHGKNIVSAFVDNSGVMDFYEGYAISAKGETHNSPSAIEPYGGAMTGTGGVFRDIVGTGQGGKTIISTDIFCLANPNLSPLLLPKGCLPPKYILKRVIKGVADYGNRMGIPTSNGSIHFHDDFRAKPTVLVGAYGIMPKKYAKRGKPKIGDVIVSIGGRVGRDGIHGATFSSGEMTDQTIIVNSQAVQIGNAIEEKRMFDAILEARDKDLIRAIQDCGGGGLSSAIGEIGEATGVSVELKNVLLKYQGLSPWEIWLSESQERMILAISKNNIKEFERICKKYNVEISILGTFDGSKKLKVYYNKKLVANLDMNFLHHGLPQRVLKTVCSNEKVPPFSGWNLEKQKVLMPQTQQQWISTLKKVLSHDNVCSKEPIVRLYDHTVQGTNILQPYGGEKMNGRNDAIVIRRLLVKPYGMVVSHGLNPILNRIDPYFGSIWAATEAISNYVAVGGDYKNASLINNYIWPFPDEESLWSLDKSVDAVCDFMSTLKMPVISGKDSLSSTYRKDNLVIKIPPVLCISVFGKIPDVKKTISSDFKKEDSVICLVGKPDFENMAGSTYLEILFNANNLTMKQFSNIPHIDLKLLPKILTVLNKTIKTGHILSCHDISEGGLITAIFEMCVGGNMGAQIHLPGGRMDSWKVERPDYFLFNETSGCFIVEVRNEKIAKKLFKNIPYLILGKTKKEKLITVKNKNKNLFGAGLDELKKACQEPMKKIFN